MWKDDVAPRVAMLMESFWLTSVEKGRERRKRRSFTAG